MGRWKNGRILLCVGAAVITGILGNSKVGEAGTVCELMEVEQMPVMQMSLLQVKDIWRTIGAEHRYIEGLAEIGEQVLQKIEAAKEEEEELVLFSRAKGLEGTRAYASVTNYVNVRQKASTSSEVVGKLFSGCVATVVEDAGNWVFVVSGNVSGYVVKDYLLFGDAAEEAIARKYSPRIQVTANELNVRSGAGTGYSVLTMFKKEDEAELLEQGKEWMKIRFSADGVKKVGYVCASYVKVTGELRYGETLAEEKERIAAEKKAAADAAAKAEAERKAAIEQSKRDKAKQVADYAKTAVGTAYVWGGTNLYKGVDCSGLCYAAYKKFGYSLPRVSRDMAASSALLSVKPDKANLRAGDLVFYSSNGRVDHVAMYIGDGKVVHASDYSTGVIISNYNYRTPYSTKRVIY